MNKISKWHLPFFLAVIGDVTGNTVEVEVVEGAGISGNVRQKQIISKDPTAKLATTHNADFFLLCHVPQSGPV